MFTALVSREYQKDVRQAKESYERQIAAEIRDGATPEEAIADTRIQMVSAELTDKMATALEKIFEDAGADLKYVDVMDWFLDSERAIEAIMCLAETQIAKEDRT